MRNWRTTLIIQNLEWSSYKNKLFLQYFHSMALAVLAKKQSRLPLLALLAASSDEREVWCDDTDTLPRDGKLLTSMAHRTIGCSAQIPSEGSFLISRKLKKDRNTKSCLPTASPCATLLYLLEHPSMSVLREQLLQIVRSKRGCDINSITHGLHSSNIIQHLHFPWQICRGPCRVSLRVSISLIIYHNARTTLPRCYQTKHYSNNIWL